MSQETERRCLMHHEHELTQEIPRQLNDSLCAHCGKGPALAGCYGLCRECNGSWAIRRNYKSPLRVAKRRAEKLAGITVPVKACLHCKQAPGKRARGLCYGCYMDAEIRECYPLLPTSHSNPENRANYERPTRLSSRPTSARPGSAVKIEVLRERVERGERLYHPDDATCFEDAWEDEEPTFLRDCPAPDEGNLDDVRGVGA